MTSTIMFRFQSTLFHLTLLNLALGSKKMYNENSGKKVGKRSKKL